LEHLPNERNAVSATILVVDDHPLILEGLLFWFSQSSHFKVIGTASDGHEALRKAKLLQPEVVIMDFGLPHLGGDEATRLIRACLPQVKVIALSAHEELAVVRRMMQAGAHGYLTKNGALSEMARGIETVLDGGLFFSSSIARIMEKDAGELQQS
jgi:two-component system, NarL family, nitrate/nitrite response regulator NarL